MHWLSLRRFLSVVVLIFASAGGGLAPTVASAATALKLNGGFSAQSTVNAGARYYYRVIGSGGNGQALKYGVVNRPSWASMNTTTGEFSGTPNSIGQYNQILFTVTDGVGTAYFGPMSITVIRSGTTTSGSGSSTANSPPVISGTPSMTAIVGKNYSFTPAAKDANGDRLAFSIHNKPSWASFNTATGQLSGIPLAAMTNQEIGISVSDGKVSTALNIFKIVVTGAAAASTPPATAGNHAPVISGTPAGAVNVGAAYSFKPAASDSDGNALAFAITNKPVWAVFNTSTGQLTGTPSAAQVATYSNIVISVSDGKTSAALNAFSIAVTQSSNGSATLSWTPPTENTDGSALVNLSGYKIYYGTNAGAMNQTIALNGTGLTSYVISNLSPATYYFAITAVSSAGLESDRSGVATKLVN